MDFENNTNNGDNTGVVIDIQKINCYIEDQFNKMDTSMKNKIELIHPQINFYYNSFNLCIGKQGCGKTTLIIKELYKLCTLPQNALYDTFIYVIEYLVGNKTVLIVNIVFLVVSFQYEVEKSKLFKSLPLKYVNAVPGFPFVFEMLSKDVILVFP